MARHSYCDYAHERAERAPVVVPNDMLLEKTCRKCGKPFRTKSRIKKRCDDCQELAAAASQKKANERSNAKRRAERVRERAAADRPGIDPASIPLKQLRDCAEILPECVKIGLLDESGAEILDPGYARQHTRYLVVSRCCYNLEPVTFGPFQNPQKISSYAFYVDDSRLHRVKLADLREVASSESISFQAGSIEILAP